MKVKCMHCKAILGEKPGEEECSDTTCSKCLPIYYSDFFTPEEIEKMIAAEIAYEASLKKS